MKTALVWFRRDLRLADNPALTAALEAYDRVLPVFIHAPDEEAPWAPGAASRWWLHGSLESLGKDLRSRGSGLHIARGPSLDALLRLLGEHGATAVYWNRLYEPAITQRDSLLKQTLTEQGFEARSFNAALLQEPWEVQTNQGQPYRVFTPYWRKARSQMQLRPPLPKPARIASRDHAAGLPLDALELLPARPWDQGLHTRWARGESAAEDAFSEFIDSTMSTYIDERDRPDRDGTSGLSPHLHFGEISPMRMAWEIDERVRSGRDAALSNGAEGFLRQLGWREFSQQLLFHFPDMPEKNLNSRFDGFIWADADPPALKRWQRGRTGIPIVDAGMRELWESGTMHNRVRMLVASFLTKNLRQHWHLGERWFWDTLVDADLANNAQGWQWTAGCGVDASPYFRIFNPVSQGMKFDPRGDYVRRWVPELADVPAPLIHRPWTDGDLLARSHYPAPIVDLDSSRQAALAAYKDLRD
ncbi:cryptochrome/photolyase family protein [Dokdonella sp.]|uniref:cryptochrome/photolyase family protein n=1 Tax=Dokdonella sp. TaxID=2291710 RepID=UPI003C5D26BD